MAKESRKVTLGSMARDIFIKLPDPRPHRWWRKPSPPPVYREGWDRIFGSKEKQDGEATQEESCTDV
jgi:hypothetical protein